jgi:hypothetical protein
MSVKHSVKTIVCSAYQTLLEECQSALELWNERRAEICQARLIGKEAGDELLLLQAKYARAYSVLQSHSHICFRCKSVSKIKRYDSENDSAVLADNKLRQLATYVYSPTGTPRVSNPKWGQRAVRFSTG